MVQGTIHRMARVLGGAGTRRAGLQTALALLASGGALALSGAAEAGKSGRNAARGKETGKGRNKDKGARRGHERGWEKGDYGHEGHGGGAGIAGPCGDGSRRSNVCTKDSQCCTGICNRKLGKKNVDGKGRCRCMRQGGPCTADRNCCGNAACEDAVCTVKSPVPGPVPAGCGTEGVACSASGECCGGLICANGLCAVLPPCTVCLTCDKKTVQAAIDAAAPGQSIFIDAGDWDEDLVIDKSLTLAPCSVEPVRLRNATSQTRTISLPVTAPGSPDGLITLTIQDLTITSTRDVQGGEAGGGIYGYGNVVLNGTAAVTGNKAYATGDTYSDSGGGINLCAGSTLDPGCALTLNGAASISANEADSYGGGVFLGPYCALEMNGSAVISGNESPYAGGVRTGSYGVVTMNGAAAILKNVSDSYGGGIQLGGYGEMTMNGSASVKDNTCSKDDGGGVFMMDSYSTLTLNEDAGITGNYSGNEGGGVTMYSYPNYVVMNGRSSISNNTVASGYDGGGVYLPETCSLTMNDDSVISGNSAPGADSRGGGVYAENVSAEFIAVIMHGNSRIYGNSANQGAGVYLFRAAQATMDGASSISGNAAAGKGGGVAMKCMANPSGVPANSKYTSVTLSGSATITGNTATEGAGVFGDLEFPATGSPGKVIGGAGITGNTPSTQQCKGTDKPGCV